MANSAGQDQLASEANWSGAILFAKEEYIRVQLGLIVWQGKLTALGMTPLGWLGHKTS